MNKHVWGRTWWGAQWLQSLTHIDYDNRLPRGRTYANRGAVSELRVAAGQIKARVQGSRALPYAVSIEVPAVTAADAARLSERLSAEPAMLARLLNRELDPEVLTIASALKITIFPARWSDLKMHCSCPDWAVPCKHLAAVIYLLSQEIDGDPFLVFRLKGVDLHALLKAQGLVAATADRAALPQGLMSLFTTAPPPPSAPSSETTAATSDFTTIPDLRDTLWRTLAAQPVFYRHGDFRELARKAISRIAREAQSRLDTPPDDAEPNVQPEGTLQLTLNAQGTLTPSGLLWPEGTAAATTLPELLRRCADWPASRLSELPEALRQLHLLRALALHLLAQGAVVPMVYASDAQHTALRWCAAELDPAVAALVQSLSAGPPPGLVQQRGELKDRRKLAPVASDVAARLLLSAAIDVLLREAAATAGVKADDKLTALFFGAALARFDGPGEGTIAGSIQAWLSRLTLKRDGLLPVLRIDELERGAGLALSLAVAATGSATAPTPLADVITKPAWAKRRMAVLQTVAMLAEFHPALNDYVRRGAREPLHVTPEQLPPLLFETLPALRLLGVRMLLPRGLERLWRPRLSMQLSARSDALPSHLKAEAIFSFDWKVALGDQLLSVAEFEKLLGKASGIVNFRGQYIYLDAAEVAALRARLARPVAMSGLELLRTALAGEYDGAPIGLNKAAAAIVEQLRQHDDVALPVGLQAVLRPYQARGYAWLWRNARLGFGSVIADDMGLGKTLQVLALLLRLKEDGALADGRALVVVPTSLLSNWQKEAARFTPGLRVDVFHGSKRELAKERPDVLLTSYGVARSEAAKLKAISWQVLVIDEAQNIKNPAAAQARAIKTIPASVRIAMSGTPVENRLSEYWSIMDFAQRGYLGGATHFAREFATPIQVHRDVAAADKLRRVMAPFMLRRLKSDRSIISDLPLKIEQDQFCSLTRSQAALYETVVREGLKAVVGQSDTFKRQGLVLQMIMALKQVCNHPAHYLKQGAAIAGESGKAERLLDLLDEVAAAQEKAIVFTQFREMGELLVRMLRERHGHAPMFLHGGVPRAQRDKMVERFQHERSQRVFLLSLKAGGTGLNLTAANHVIHFDLWWNPAVEAQATDRAYRIGQQRNVQVHRLITRGSFEERINQMMRSKRELAEMTVGSGETWIGQLPAEDLKALFALG